MVRIQIEDARKTNGKFDEMKNTASLTNQKLNSILSFLDEVETDNSANTTFSAKEKPRTKLNSSRQQKEKKTQIDRFFESNLEMSEVNSTARTPSNVRILQFEF
jgi:hypothetical protein